MVGGLLAALLLDTYFLANGTMDRSQAISQLFSCLTSIDQQRAASSIAAAFSFAQKIGSGQGKAFPSAPYHPPIRKNGKIISDAGSILVNVGRSFIGDDEAFRSQHGQR